jgi:hypothetical protein
MRHLRFVAALVFCLVTPSGGAPAQPEPAPASLYIRSVIPPIAEKLRPGQRVNFVVEVEYSLSGDEGNLALFIQRAEPGGGALATSSQPVSGKSGVTRLFAEIEVPRTRNVQLIVALYEAPGRSSSVTDSRVYEVFRE